MKNLLILVKMQLKEQLNFKRLDVENVSVFHIIASIVGSVLKFALIVALCVAFLLVSKLLGLFSLANRPVPSTVISLVFSFMMVASIISCVVGLTKSMYYARDNAVLLTLPCTPTQVYLSKLVIFFIFEIKRNFSFTIPLFIAYYATHSYGVGTYFWMLFCMCWISLFTVAIGALLSIPAMWIANFFRQRKWLQIASLALTVSAGIALIFYGVSIIPENIDLLATWETIYWDIQGVLNDYAAKFSALYDITLMLLGETKALVTVFPFGRTIARLAILAGATVALLALGMLLVRPLFYKMASTPFEYLKKQIKPKKNKLRTRRWTSVYHEFLKVFKSSDRLFQNFGILVSIPFLTFLLNKIFHAMKTRDVGDYMTVAFNVLIILLIALNSNCYASSLFSKEGRSSYLIKTQPSKYPILILAKLLPNTAFVCTSLFATFIVLAVSLPIAPIDSLMLMLSIGMIYLAHMLYSAELDLMNPQLELYSTVGSSESNPNEIRSTLLAFLISFLAAGLTYFLLWEGAEFRVYDKFLIVAAVALVYRVKIFFAKLRLYYKEKE